MLMVLVRPFMWPPVPLVFMLDYLYDIADGIRETDVVVIARRVVLVTSPSWTGRPSENTFALITTIIKKKRTPSAMPITHHATKVKKGVKKDR